ncbi:hypothetical protein ACI65C_005616 [Semiaphis heraclei]
MAAHTGSSQVAGPSNHADPELSLDRGESDSDSMSNCDSSGESETPVPRRQPTLDGRALTFWFPLPSTICCPHDRCSAKFRVKLWTSGKQSVVRHVRDLHEEADSIVVRCVGCRVVLGIRPGAHKCSVPIEAADDTANRFACTEDGCGMSFPTKQGLANHLRNHRQQIAIAAAAVPLPAPATRQRLRAAQVPLPARGGDARVPVEQAADVPRIPAGNRPPDTGGTSPRPPTLAEPGIPAGNRPPDTGGSAMDVSVVTGGRPRIPAGNRPPATGGPPLSPEPSTSPRPPTLAEPGIPAGNRPPDTGGSAMDVSVVTGGRPRIPAGNRPPDTGGPPLSPEPSMRPTASRPATPMRPRGAGDRLSLPLPPHLLPRTESPRNEAYHIVVASPELWRPRETTPAVSDSSASSGIAVGDDDLLGLNV